MAGVFTFALGGMVITFDGVIQRQTAKTIAIFLVDAALDEAGLLTQEDLDLCLSPAPGTLPKDLDDAMRQAERHAQRATEAAPSKPKKKTAGGGSKVKRRPSATKSGGPAPTTIDRGNAQVDNVLATLNALGGKATTEQVRQRLLDEEITLKGREPMNTLYYLKSQGRIDRKGDEWVAK